ncbi:MAG TPA: glycosyltransferase family 39 protein, partial [Tahibacter sp.]|nr:glycosyltransferase family 39 protein [Tahibacter sp.]
MFLPIVTRRLALVLVALVLAFGFLGTRGIWDPDEGRYTNVALNMLSSGDWLNPMRNEDVGHWTKPPATYWLVAASVGAFGRNPWAARLPMALAYLACVWLVWRTARRLAPGSETTAATVYATMLLPFAAAQLITTDYPLAAAQAFAA